MFLLKLHQAFWEGFPTWARAFLAVTMLLGFLLLRVLKRVIPQDSPDRLSWWLAVLRHRRSRREAQGQARRR